MRCGVVYEYGALRFLYGLFTLRMDIGLWCMGEWGGAYLHYTFAAILPYFVDGEIIEGWVSCCTVLGFTAHTVLYVHEVRT